jgi:lipopolysaccharide biosynthesis glycosyltransferase
VRIFIGYDPRQPIAYNVLQHSIISRSSKPVQITPLILDQLPIKRRGLTEFTYSRFLVPWLCNYEGRALFLDADMLCLADIQALFALADGDGVQIVMNEQKFEWPSLMLFNCAACEVLTPGYVETSPSLFKMDWAPMNGLPFEWNHIVGYDRPKTANIVHFTKGIPVWDETWNCEYAEEWHQERKASMTTCSHQELMGGSRHVA